MDTCPAISGQPFEAMQSLLEPAQLVPFIAEQRSDDTFPVFVGDQTSAIDDTASYHLLNPHSQGEDVVNPSVQLQMLPSGNKFRVLGWFCCKQIQPVEPAILYSAITV